MPGYRKVVFALKMWQDVAKMRWWVTKSLLLVLVAAPVLYAQTPSLPQGGVVNGASFIAASQPNSAVAPGTIVAIFGSNLSSATAAAMSVPLSTTLNDTSVTFNGVAAPLFFVSSGQINAQLPFETPAGTVQVQARRGNLTSETRTVQVAAASPGIFTLNQQGTGAGAILHANSPRVVSSSDPATAGEFLSIFCTGLGAVSPSVPSGNVGPGSPPATTQSPPLVDVGGMAAQVSFSGLAPGFVGLYQVNIQVPAGVQPGNEVPLKITMNSVPGNTVTIAVR